jgi:NADH dehydrogenase FAD-containing subunit
LFTDYLQGKAVDVDIANKKVTVKLNSLLDEVREGEPPLLELDYDHLVVSVGCKVDSKGVPGAEKALKLKSLDDARKLRQAIGECFEYSSRPDVAGPEHAEKRRERSTFLVVGGGPTGVEISGELHDLAKDITRNDKGTYPNLEGNIRIILAHSGSELVPQFDQSLREEAIKSLQKKGIEVILDTRVTEVGDGFAKLSKKVFDENGEVTGRDEFTVPVGLTVWCAGTSPVKFVDQLLDQLPEEARNLDGRIKVDRWMRPPMLDDELMGSVFVLGDAAAFPEGDENIARDAALPQTAQVAGQQGAYLARMFNRGYELNMTPPVLSDMTFDDDPANVFNDPLLKSWLEVRGITEANPFVFLNLGLLAYLGGGESLAQIKVGDVPIFSYWGSVAFVLWRSVYLVKQVATRNRVLVTFDWIKSAIFGRDMTRF